MEKFYTDTPNAEIIDELINIGYSPDEADPAFGITYPTYADVLDWLISQGFHISIASVGCTDDCFGFVGKDDKLKTTNRNNLVEALDKIILLAIEFLKNDNL